MTISRIQSRLAAIAAIAALLAGCSNTTTGNGLAEPRPATRPSGADLLQQVRSAGELGDELDVQPLRDPRVEDLRADASEAEARGDYAAAAKALAQAERYTPDDPDLLQWQAELALAAHDWDRARELATKSWDHGPKLGGLCRRNWTALRLAAEGKGDAAAGAQAQERVAACKVAPPVRL